MQMFTTFLRQFAEFRRDDFAHVNCITHSRAFAYLSQRKGCERDSGQKVGHSNPLDATYDERVSRGGSLPELPTTDRGRRKVDQASPIS